MSDKSITFWIPRTSYASRDRAIVRVSLLHSLMLQKVIPTFCSLQFKTVIERLNATRLEWPKWYKSIYILGSKVNKAGLCGDCSSSPWGSELLDKIMGGILRKRRQAVLDGMAWNHVDGTVQEKGTSKVPGAHLGFQCAPRHMPSFINLPKKKKNTGVIRIRRQGRFSKERDMQLQSAEEITFQRLFWEYT